jgi:hypothetical protein
MLKLKKFNIYNEKTQAKTFLKNFDFIFMRMGIAL